MLSITSLLGTQKGTIDSYKKSSLHFKNIIYSSTCLIVVTLGSIELIHLVILKTKIQRQSESSVKLSPRSASKILLQSPYSTFKTIPANNIHMVAE